MSVVFDVNGEYLRRTSDLPSFTAWTFSLWVRFNQLNEFQYIVERGDFYHWLLIINADSTLRFSSDAVSGTSAGFSALSTGRWYNIAGYKSGNNVQFFLDGVAGTLFTTDSTSLSNDQMTFGNGADSGTGFNPVLGALAGIKVWNRVLTAAEIRAEMYSMSPVTWPAHGVYPCRTPRDARLDYSGASRHFTLGGSPTTYSDPPRARTSTRSFIVIPWWHGYDAAAAGGTTFFQTVSGAVTPAGVLTKQTSTAKTGALATAGALVRQVARSLVASTAPTGTVVKSTGKPVAGSVASAGGLAAIKTVLWSVAGAVSTSGALVRQTQKGVAGVVSPSASIEKRTSKAFAGAVASSGALAAIRTTLLALAGALSSTGTLARRTTHLVAGAMSSAGTLTRRPARALTASIGPVGAVPRTTLRALVGSVSSAGALVRQARGVVSGALALAGGLVRQVRRTFAGLLALTGTLAAFVAGDVDADLELAAIYTPQLELDGTPVVQYAAAATHQSTIALEAQQE